MDTDPTAALAGELLAHEAFVRRIAARLLHDPSRVDDVVQQTWLAALRRRPDARGGLGAWLARVARNFALESRRGDERREERERRAARAERLPSVEAIRAREAARHAVVEAVLALEEPFRSAVLLRFLDGLPPRAVARALGVPVETARSRVRRGLEQVRARLDRERGGDGRAWALALAPIAAVPAPGGAAIGRVLEHVGEVISMGTKAKLGIAAAALLALAGAWWQLGARADSGGGRDGLAARTGVAQATALESGGAKAPATAGAGDAAREHVAPADTASSRGAESPAFGSARVRAIWASDKTPAAHVAVRAATFTRPGGQFAWDVPRGVTNAAGELSFDRLPIGDTYFDTDRGDSLKATIRAGEISDVVIVLPAGFRLDVVVVDASGAPVEDAEVWLSVVCARASTGHVVGRTSKTGTLALRDLRYDAYVGARSDRFAPSSTERMTGSEGAAVSVRLQLGAACGEVRGRVLDADGAPVNEGWALLGDEEPRAMRGDDGVERWRSTGACVPIENGRFAARGLPAGALPYTARAGASAPTRGFVDVVAGGVVELEIRLARGGTILGRALDAGGRAVEQAQVVVGYVGVFDGVATFTAKDGSYRLDGVPPGNDVEIHAWKEIRDSASGRLEVRESAETRWDPVLPIRDRAIRGRVVDERGAPLARWRVEAHARYAPGLGSTQSTSDADGRFEIEHCSEGMQIVEAFEPWSSDAQRDPTRMFEFPSGAVDCVEPGRDDVVITVPDSERKTASLLGVVVDSDGKPAANARVTIGRPQDFHRFAVVNDASGAFRFGHLPGGTTFVIRVEKDGFPAIERVVPSLAPSRATDLGAVKLERGGTVWIELLREDGRAFEGPFAVSAEPKSAKGACHWIDDRDREGNAFRSQRLAPGAYRLRVEAEGAACALPEFEIRAGEETRLSVTVRAGFARTVRLAKAAGVTIRDADGRVAWTARVGKHGDGPPQETFTLAPGAYRIDAVADDGTRGEAAFEVAGPAKPSDAIDVALR